MVVVWVLTLPAAGLMGALGHEGVQAFPSDTAGVIAVGLVALVIAGSLFCSRAHGHVNSRERRRVGDAHDRRHDRSARVIPAASFQQYLPIAELLKIIAVCIAVAVAAPTSAALVITGFEAKANATDGRRRLAGDARIAAGVVVIAAMIAAGIYAMTNK